MKFFITSFFLMMFSALNAVNAFDNVILQVHMNTDSGSCEGDDWDYVSHRVYTMSIVQRQLRGQSDIEDENAVGGITNAVDNKARELTYPRYCANRCSGYATGRCLALTCVGYRRNLAESARELFWSTNCDNQKSEVRNLFNNMANVDDLDEGCKASLRATGTDDMHCFSNVDCHD